MTLVCVVAAAGSAYFARVSALRSVPARVSQRIEECERRAVHWEGAASAALEELEAVSERIERKRKAAAASASRAAAATKEPELPDFVASLEPAARERMLKRLGRE